MYICAVLEHYLHLKAFLVENVQPLFVGFYYCNTISEKHTIYVGQNFGGSKFFWRIAVQKYFDRKNVGGLAD